MCTGGADLHLGWCQCMLGRHTRTADGAHDSQHFGGCLHVHTGTRGCMQLQAMPVHARACPRLLPAKYAAVAGCLRARCPASCNHNFGCGIYSCKVGKVRQGAAVDHGVKSPVKSSQPGEAPCVSHDCNTLSDSMNVKDSSLTTQQLASSVRHIENSSTARARDM
jgi:hypothetical protein